MGSDGFLSFSISSSSASQLPEAYRGGSAVRIVINYLPKGGDCAPVTGWFRFLVEYGLPAGSYRVTVYDIRAGEAPLLTRQLSIGG